MIKTRTACAAIVILTAWLGNASAFAEEIKTVDLPDRYLVGRAPAGLTPPADALAQQPARETTQSETRAGTERAQAMETTAYTVIAPVFRGEGGSNSFIRFISGTRTNIATNIWVVGTPSGTVLGEAHVIVQRYASPQYSIQQVLDAAEAKPLPAGDTGYALYMQSRGETGGDNGFQHVIFNAGNGFFENASLCTWSTRIDYTNAQRVLFNVHTSVLPLYPSQIFIHNYNIVPTTYEVAIADSRTGVIIGRLNLRLEANSSYTVPFAYFEQALGWVPNSRQEHANMFLAPVGDAQYNAIIGQYIYNAQFGSLVNMSQVCSINQ